MSSGVIAFTLVWVLALVLVVAAALWRSRWERLEATR
jgi:hypothetical protein